MTFLGCVNHICSFPMATLRILCIVWDVTLKAVQKRLSENESEIEKEKLHSVLMSLQNFFNAGLTVEELGTPQCKVQHSSANLHALLHHPIATISLSSTCITTVHMHAPISGDRTPVPTNKGPHLQVLYGTG